MKKVGLIFIIFLIVIIQVSAFSLIDILKNFNVGKITGFAPAPDSYILTVSKTGLGTVTSSPSGISCGSTCSASYSLGTSVTLIATPAPGYTFGAWSGACSGTGTCTVTMNAAKTVSATFSLIPETQTQSECQQAGGTCRDICLSNEHADNTLSCEIPLGGTGAVIESYCCMLNSCSENWQCTVWSTCVNNQQSRTCTDLNNCGTIINKPATIQSCTITQNQCELNGGVCRQICLTNEEIDYTLTPYCEVSGQSSTGSATLNYCCKPKTHCSDGTSVGQCSSNFKYCNSNFQLIDNCNFCGCPSNKQCNNNICIDSYTQGNESNNSNLLNLPPLFLQIQDMSFPINGNLNNILNLNQYVIDPNQDIIFFSFNNLPTFSSEVVDCTITNSIINCIPKAAGSSVLIIRASDGISSTQSMFTITIFDPLATAGPGIVGAAGNTPPVADAGTDKIVYVNQYVNLDASKSYDNENNIIYYEWFENENKIGEGISLKKKFTEFGSYQIKIKVTDANNEFSEDSITLSVGSKEKCLDTDTVYFPQDTICNKAWPSNEGVLININSPINSCDLIEVCNSKLDSIIEDAIDCCDSTGLIDLKKINACNFAIENSQDSKKCQALYIIKALGSSAIYMQDYFEAEMCCYGVEELCLNPINLYTAMPIPKTNKQLPSLICLNTPEKNEKGSWISDTKLELNNIALSDIHAGASVDSLGTGTCVDYSAVLTTLLRKIGYLKLDVFTVEASTHAYNLVRFPLDKKYTIIDVTGNNDGIKLGKVPNGYQYCENIKNCYNDNGEQLCPNNNKIFGCEGIKENIFRESKVIGKKAKNIFEWLKQAILKEINR